MVDKAYEKLDLLIRELHSESDRDKSLDIAIDMANEFMRIIFPKNSTGQSWCDELLEGDDLLDEAIPVKHFPNQKVESWFEKHPYLGGERTALNLFLSEDAPIEGRFYWLNKSSAKTRIAAGVALTPNWEDSDLFKLPKYKIGIDFFLSAECDALLVALSNEGRLRVLELSERLTNTQVDILRNIDGAAGFGGIGDLEPQRTIHKTLWDAFALKEVNKRFYEGIAEHFNILLQHLTGPAGKPEEDAKLFANRLIGRLLFIWFLRKKGFINENVGYFAYEGIPATEYYDGVLKNLFFNTLNEPKNSDKRYSVNGLVDTSTPFLNGGLFDPRPNDWKDEVVDFPPDWFESMFHHFEQFNFTTDESTPEYEQVAIDPEMLGRVFENLLASQLDETGKEARKASGSFYTPREIVSYMCKESLRQYLYEELGGEGNREGVDRLLDISDHEFEIKHSDAKKSLWGSDRAKDMATRAIEALDKLRVIDPACGSGAFPMGMLQLLMKTYARLGAQMSPYEMKLQILGNNIFGVDIQPMAVEISRLRAWLSIVVDEKDAKNVRPLPNLDFRFVCANTLIPLQEEQSKQLGFWDDDLSETESKLNLLRSSYFRSTEPEDKKNSRTEYYAIRFEDSAKDNKRMKQLKSWDPFNLMEVASFFDPDTMFGIKDGFDVVIGNPPYVQLQKMKEVSSKLYKPLNYATYESTGDLYALFYERGFDLLREGGTLCYITSNKWMRAAYGASLRDFFLKHTNPIRLIDFAGTKVFESATVDVNILLGNKEANFGKVLATVIRNECQNNLSDYVRQHAVEAEFALGESWSILSPIEQSIKRKIEASGRPLAECDVRINRGILTGCNDAFIIDGATKDRLIAEDPKSAEIIRPILRGRDIKRYSCEFNNWWLISTFPAKGYDINDYPAIKKFLLGLRPKIDQNGQAISESERKSIVDHAAQYGIVFAEKDLKKARKKTCNKWFETQDTIAYWDDFSKQKIVWGNLCLNAQFAIAEAGYVINAPSPLITPGDPWLLAFLNSAIADFYIRTLGVTRNGGYFEYKPMFVERLPVPYFTDEEKRELASLANKQWEGTDVSKRIDLMIAGVIGLDNSERSFLHL